MENRPITYRDFIKVGNKMKGYDQCKQTFIEAVEMVHEEDKTFPRDRLISAFADCLHHNGVISEPSLLKLAALDNRIIAKYERNYRMLDLLDGVATLYMIREEIPRTNLEIVGDNVVRFPRSAS